MTGYVITTYLSITTHREKEMSVDYNFHSRDGKPKPKESPKELDQTSATPKERMIVSIILLVVIGLLVVSIMDII